MSNLSNEVNNTLGELLQRMALNKRSPFISDKPPICAMYFTGWKEIPIQTEWMYYEDGAFLGSGTAVGQLIYILGENPPRKIAFVNLPGMERGIIEEGNCLDIGTARIDLNKPPSIEDTELMLNDAIRIMEELVEST